MVSAGVTGGRVQQLRERREEELSERREELLPEGAIAGVTGGGELTTLATTALLVRFSLSEQSSHLIRPTS